MSKEEDRGAILGTAYMLGHDLEAQGVSIIPCGGKGNIDRPMMIFREFGIKTFAVWDGDRERKDAPPLNRRLLRLLNQPLADYPPTQVLKMFACFEDKLHRTMLDEIGERAYSDISQYCHSAQEQEMYSTEPKNALMVAHIIQEAASRDLRSPTLELIVERILAIKQMPNEDYFQTVSQLEGIERAITAD